MYDLPNYGRDAARHKQYQKQQYQISPNNGQSSMSNILYRTTFNENYVLISIKNITQFQKQYELWNYVDGKKIPLPNDFTSYLSDQEKTMSWVYDWFMNPINDILVVRLHATTWRPFYRSSDILLAYKCFDSPKFMHRINTPTVYHKTDLTTFWSGFLLATKTKAAFVDLINHHNQGLFCYIFDVENNILPTSCCMYPGYLVNIPVNVPSSTQISPYIIPRISKENGQSVPVFKIKWNEKKFGIKKIFMRVPQLPEQKGELYQLTETLAVWRTQSDHYYICDYIL